MEQIIRKDVTQKEGRTREEFEEQLWEDVQMKTLVR
jgi:hypothetical protein